MRILHIATLVTPDGAYGGPIRVALNQLGELAKRGHDVELIAGYRGFTDRPPTSIQGVPVRLFRANHIAPGMGYASLHSRGLQRYLKKNLRDYDVVHTHVARDLITLPAARRAISAGMPLVLQPHGMIDESPRLLSRVVDALLTKHVLHRANAILSLTPLEASSLEAVGGAQNGPVRFISNGLRMPPVQSAPTGRPEVLFLARLHPRKRAPDFVRMAATLIDLGSDAQFTLVGPDEGDGDLVTSLIEQLAPGGRITWEGAIPPEATMDRMSRASVYVLPAVNEVFPMSVLEALSLGISTVITESNGLASLLSETGAAKVVDSSLEGLIAGTKWLLDNDADRSAMSVIARDVARNRFSIEAVADTLEDSYESAIASLSPSSRRVKGRQ